MKHLDEYRDPQATANLTAEIRQRCTRPWTIMEVCGGQTHNLLRYGLDEALSGCVELIHGPGCPVCVTGVDLLDQACSLAQRPGVCVATFGDMLRVPGSRGTLAETRAGGGCVRTVYSPLDAVLWAQQSPDIQVVFFAVGFETTAPAAALALKQAAALNLPNFSLLVAHVRVLPAMEALLAHAGGVRVDGFLAAGHVCTILGYSEYTSLVERFATPVVVTGFEPVDLLRGIRACVELLEIGQPAVQNLYGRSVRAEGNPAARALLDDVFEPCTRPWRGLGEIPLGGLRLRGPWQAFDAALRFPAPALACGESPLCRSGDVLRGRIKPNLCEAFGRECTPERPLGAPMVSSEGACAAYYRFHAAREPAATGETS